MAKPPHPLVTEAREARAGFAPTTKAKTEGQKRKAKRGRPPKDGLREPSGKLQRISPTKGSTVREACIARAHASGWELPVDDAGIVQVSQEQMRILLQPWMGSRAGRAIAQEPDVTDLWGVIQGIVRAHHAYLRAIDAPSLIGQRLGDKPPPDQEAHRPDTRPLDERAQRAVSAWCSIEAAVPAWVLRAILDDNPPNPFADALRGLTG